jgi:ElaB/YqjD/DUF883 family membrane-anchored ribosome-binding protein
MLSGYIEMRNLFLIKEQTMAEQRPSGSGERSPAQETGMQVRQTANEVSAQVSETARQVGETASQYYAQGRETMGDVERYLEDNIRAKPLQSVLIAAGVGLVLALLYKR